MRWNAYVVLTNLDIVGFFCKASGLCWLGLSTVSRTRKQLLLERRTRGHGELCRPMHDAIMRPKLTDATKVSPKKKEAIWICLV